MPRINVASLIIRSFDALFDDVMGHLYDEYWMKGGRASTKSSFISICIVLLVVMFPWANAVVLRRFSNTMRDSVYMQMLWAIGVLRLSDYFKASVSPMEITYISTGQKIVFRGMDDPLKIKGVKFAVGYCAIQWFEEIDQFSGWEAVRSALKSLKRGGAQFWTFFSYNPPKTLWSWVNKQALEMGRKPSAIVHHSTYLDVLKSGNMEWLGKPFVDDAEWLKETNERAYLWEMMGEITGTGGSVFDNVPDDRYISDKEIQSFADFRNGVDWGWFPDPWRFVRCNYVASERRLYVFEEHSAHRKEPRDTGKIALDALTYANSDGGKAEYHAQTIWCDDTADGKQQMATYRRKFGLRARPARKGNMRDLSYQWLAGLREIVIDPKRCPLTYEEFKLKEFERDRNDDWIDEIPDGNDHSIDAVRYALMEDARRGR